MSRAARRPPAERRAELASAARALALDEGLAAVTLRAVAARAAVTPALVAHYHESMEALVAETFTSIVAAEIAELRGLLAAAPSPAAGLATLLRTLLDGSRDDVTVVWVEAWALGRRNPVLGAAVRDQMDAWIARRTASCSREAPRPTPACRRSTARRPRSATGIGSGMLRARAPGASARAIELADRQ